MVARAFLMHAVIILAFCGPSLAQGFDPRDERGFDRRERREFDVDERRGSRQRGRDDDDLDQGTRYCSVVTAGNWRDTFPVPDTWTVRDCRELAARMGATTGEAVCLFRSGRPKFSLGGPDGSPPEPDCGWEGRRR